MAHGAVKLALWGRDDLAHDTGQPQIANIAAAFTLGHNVAERHEVDAVMCAACKAGADMIKPAQETFWGGYAGYFRDPDGHVWEVVWNPQFIPDDA
ncbi:VOC family protein [Allorhizobium sonneratiae]|uniref:VOC family protein n=1 Tax=Allorhizobium sonneratiae TaxID=2934936 RepID=UPI0030843F54